MRGLYAPASPNNEYSEEVLNLDRAYAFLDKIEHELLKLMDKEIHELHPKELDLIVGLCDTHAGVCEFIELAEKFDGKTPGTTTATGMFGDNPRRRR